MKAVRKELLAELTPELLAEASRAELVGIINMLSKMVLDDEEHIRKLVQISGASLLLDGSEP